MDSEFCNQLFYLRDQALEAAGDACGALIRKLDEGDAALADAMAKVTDLQSYASWWMGVTDDIEHGGMDPFASLTRARTAAWEGPRYRPAFGAARPYADAEALARRQATRRFYDDSALSNIRATPGITTAPAARPDSADAGDDHACGPETG